MSLLDPTDRREGWRRFGGDFAIPIAALTAFGVALAAVLLGVVRETAALGLGLILTACVGGALLAAVLKVTSRTIDAPDHQQLSRHPGWFRVGPVGGVGGAIGLLGFLIIAVLRGPIFLPFLAVALPFGVIVALVIHRRRAHSVSEQLPTISASRPPDSEQQDHSHAAPGRPTMR
jgi:hypothetical protein